MISVEEACRLVLDEAKPVEPRSVPLAASLDQVLAQAIISDVDSPPHDKSLVDGFAVRAEDLAAPPVVLRVLEEITAGRLPTRAIMPGSTSRIMTGAPMPPGADAVVMLEDSEATVSDADEELVRLLPQGCSRGQNVMRRGASLQAGQTVLTPGHLVRPAEIGLMAEVGVCDVLAIPAPHVAVLSTGDELVPVDQKPAAGQIRNSNGAMLDALVRRAGGVPQNLGIAVDQRDELTRLVTQGLQSDALVLSGGVSAGVLDLVPSVLAQLGVQQIFHKVALKPGKPLWFGVHAAGCLVFGLPGNPVSSLVCFELFVRPALRQMAGKRSTAVRRHGTLAAAFTHRGQRPTYHPSIATSSETALQVEPLRWQGSADLRTLSFANCLAVFPAGDRIYDAGSAVELYWLD